MAFTVAGTTAGTGTVSVAANGVVVTGVGTSFAAADIGKIIQIGSTFAVGGLVRAVNSTTEVILDRPIATAQTGQTWRFVTAISQSGTDANPSALTTIPGINAVTDMSSSNVTNYEMGLVALTLGGQLTVPDRNFLRWSGNRTAQVLTINNGGEIIIDGRLTITRRGTMLTGTVTTSGTAVTGTGTLFTKEVSVGQWVNDGTNVRQVTAIASDTAMTLANGFPTNLTNVSLFELPGGTSSMTTTVYSQNCGVINRSAAGTPFLNNGILVNDGGKITQYGGLLESSATIRFNGSSNTILTLRDATWGIYDRSGNGYVNIYMPISKIDADGWTIKSNGAASPGFLSALASGYGIKRFLPIGCQSGLDPIDGQTALVAFSGYQGGGSQFDFKFRNGGTVSGDAGAPGGYDFTDAALGNDMTSIGQGAAQNQGRARHFVTYTPRFQSAANAAAISGGILYLADTDNGTRRTTNGVPGGKTYTATTSAAGGITSQSILTGVWTGDGTAAFPYFDNRLPVAGYMWAYGFAGLAVNVTSSIGPQSPTLFAAVDPGVTLSEAAARAKLASSFAVDTAAKTVTVTANSTFDDVYDALKAWKCVTTNVTQPTLATQVVSASSANLTAATGWTLVVNTGVTLSAGVKFTYLRFDTITMNGTAVIAGLYGTSVGNSTTFTLTGVAAGSTVYVADNSGATRFLQTGRSGTVTLYIAPGASGIWTWAATAYGNVVQSGTFTPSGGVVTDSPTIVTDSNVTRSSSAASGLLTTTFTIDPAAKTVTVIGNATYDDLYDALKSYKLTASDAAQTAPVVGALIVNTTGTQMFAATGWRLIVASNITLSSGTKFTYVKFDAVTMTGSITGLYATSAGDSCTLELREVSNGSAYCVYNAATGATIAYGVNGTGTNQTYRVYFAPGSAGTMIGIVKEKYGFQRNEEVVSLQAGLSFLVASDVGDVGITNTNQAQVAAYTSIENADKLYDYTALFRLSEAGIKLGQITTRDGTDIDVSAPYSIRINQNATAVYGISGNTITLKANGYANGARFTNTVLVPPATLTATTNEVLSASFEDAGGDSSVTINGGDGTFELWKVPTATLTADYQTGVKLTAPTVGNGRWRFIGVSGFDIVGVDINSNVRRRTSMAKGNYVQAFFVGDQIQVAQAPQINQINTKVDSLAVDIAAIKGTGFVPADNSLKALRTAVDNVATSGIQPVDIATAVWAAGTRTLTGWGPIVSDIRSDLERAGGMLAGRATPADVTAAFTAYGAARVSDVQALGSPLQASAYVAPDNAGIAAIKAKTDMVVSAAETAKAVRAELSTELGLIDAAISTRATSAEVTGTPDVVRWHILEAQQGFWDNLISPKLNSVSAGIQALGSPLQAAAYVASATPEEIADAVRPDLATINRGVKRASQFRTHREEL